MRQKDRMSDYTIPDVKNIPSNKLYRGVVTALDWP